MFSMNRRFYLSLLLLLFLTLVCNVSLLAVPVFSLQIFDRVLGSGSIETLYMLLAAAIIVGLFHVYFEYRRQSLPIKLLHQYFNQHHKSAAINACQNANTHNYQQLGQLLNSNVNTVLSAALDALFSPLFIVVLYFLHPMFAALVSLINLLFLMVICGQHKVLTQQKTRLSKQQTLQKSHLAELIYSAKSLLADNRLLEWLGHSPSPQFNDQSINLKKTENYFKGIFVFLKWCLQLSLPTIGALLLLSNQITSGTLLAAVIIGFRGLIPFEVLLNQWQLSDKIIKLVKTQHSFEQQNVQEKTRPLMPLEGGIRINKLSIQQADRDLLNVPELIINPAEKVAIIGANGSGKSLLIDSLVGVVVGLKSEGHIYFDQYQADKIDHDWLGKQLGYVPQNLRMASSTIVQLICRYQEMDKDRVVQVAKQLAIHQSITSLPQGYDTPVGLQETNLPAGIIQRVLIASAIYPKPKYVFFDESDAFLDQAGQQIYKQLLISLQEQGTTVVYATQRRSLVDVADKVILMENGGCGYLDAANVHNISLIKGPS